MISDTNRKIHSWKIYISLYECRQNQGKKNFWNCKLDFLTHGYLAPATHPVRLDFMFMSVQPSEGQWTISKIPSPLILSIFIDQNILFPATYFDKGIWSWFGPGYCMSHILCSISKSAWDMETYDTSFKSSWLIFLTV